MMATEKTLSPTVLWAQRTNEIYITVQLSDAKDVKTNLTPSSLSFSGISGGNSYAFTLDFVGKINVEESKEHISDRVIAFILSKEEKEAAWWPKLVAVKPFYLKIDFGKWKDEDEEDEDDSAGGMPGGMDFSSMMGGGGGMPGGMDLNSMMKGMGGMGMGGGDAQPDFGADSDDEDDELPPLEDAPVVEAD